MESKYFDGNPDTTLGSNNPSDYEPATQAAIKTYIDNLLAL